MRLRRLISLIRNDPWWLSGRFLLLSVSWRSAQDCADARAIVPRAQLVVEMSPSSSTAYPQPAMIHQPACAASRKPACMEPRSDAASTYPTMATPSEVPSWRLAEFIPEATPAWDFGRPDMKPLVIAELTIRTPTPNRP